jgi:hypothetical protein
MAQELMLEKKSSKKFQYIISFLLIGILIASFFTYQYSDYIMQFFSKTDASIFIEEPIEAQENLDNREKVLEPKIEEDNPKLNLVTEPPKNIHSDIKNNSLANLANSSEIVMKMFIKFQNNENYNEELRQLQHLPLSIEAKKQLAELQEYQDKYLSNIRQQEQIIFPTGKFSSIISNLIIVKKIHSYNLDANKKQYLSIYFNDLNNYFHSANFIKDSEDAENNN